MSAALRQLEAVGIEDAIAAPPMAGKHWRILRHVVAGDTDKQIGLALGRSPYTIKVQVRELLRRYSCANRTQLAVLAVRRGWF